PSPLYRLCFFPRYAAPRDLPSFPTRRSSDLQPLAIICPLMLQACKRARGDARALFEPLGGDARECRPLHLVARGLPCLARGAKQDRKSTRLNSSHVKISYAVFCLKKKKRDTK